MILRPVAASSNINGIEKGRPLPQTGNVRGTSGATLGKYKRSTAIKEILKQTRTLGNAGPLQSFRIERSG